MKNIVIVGGGTGGTIIANNLAHKLHGRLGNDVEITVIEPSALHIYQPAYLLIPFDIVHKDKAVRREASLLDEGVKLRQEAATKIDLANRTVRTNSTELKYDYLVIATGSKPDYSAIKGFFYSSASGLEPAGHDFYTLENSLRLREALSRFEGGRLVVVVGGLPFKCPTAPMEFVLLADSYFRKLGVRDKVQLQYAYPLPRPFTIPNVADEIQRIMDERKIETTLMFNLDSVDPVKKEITSMEGETIKYDMAVFVPPHTGADVLKSSGIADKGGWVPTDKYTLRVKGYDDAYAIGDATDLPVSKAGSVADYESTVVANNIYDELNGLAPSARYNGKVMCFVLTGIGEASALLFDYEHPTRFPRPNFAYYWYKIIYNDLYWTVTTRGALSGFEV